MMQRNYNPITGEITVVEYQEPYISLDDKKSLSLKELSYIYSTCLDDGFNSSANGTIIQYGYSQNMQMVYSKWANILALNSNIADVTFSISNGVVTLTRDQFVQFMSDAQSFEISLFNKLNSYKNQISSATTVDEINAINMVF